MNFIKIKPFTEDEAKADGKLREGYYDGYILESDIVDSKSSNETMIRLVIRFESDYGRYFSVIKNILLREDLRWLLRQLCNATGTSDMLLTGDIDASKFKDKTMRCNLKYGKPKQNGNSYLEIAQIVEEEETIVNDKKEEKPFDDDLTF